MNNWNEIYEAKIEEGYSEDAAYDFASKEMAKRRDAFDTSSIIGLQEQTAKEKLEENGYLMRVTKRDVGHVGGMHLDYRTNRCNVSIKKGCIGEISSMG